MRKLIAFFFLFALASYGAEKHILTITITNLPVTGNNLSFSGPATKVITWSNITSSAWVATNTTVNGCATNLFLQMAANAPWSPRPALSWANTNSFNVEADCGQVVTVTNSGTWATLSINTNDCTRQRTVNVPISAEKWATSRVEIASLVVKGINDYSTNSIDSNSVALAHALQLSTNAQTVLGAKTFNQIAGGTNTGTLYRGTYSHAAITNAQYMHGSNIYAYHGYWTNGRADNLISSNLVNYGNAISSPGPSYAASAEQFGTGASATNAGALAVGVTALAGGSSSMAIGNQAISTNEAAIAVGGGAVGGGRLSTAIGPEAQAYGTNSVALGNAVATHQYSVAIGTGASTTTNNQLVLGSSTDVYLITGAGRANFGSITNNLFTGTNRNDGAWGDTPVTITSLANGNNVLNPSNARVIRLAAGPTAGFSINSIQGGWNGRAIEVWNDTGQVMTISHESGFDATNVNRIITSGADVVTLTNAYVTFRYFTDRNRWKLSGSRE